MLEILELFSVQMESRILPMILELFLDQAEFLVLPMKFELFELDL